MSPGVTVTAFVAAADGDEEAGEAIEASMAGAKVASRAGRKKGRLVASGARPPSAAGTAGSSAATAAAGGTTPKAKPALTAGVSARLDLSPALPKAQACGPRAGI